MPTGQITILAILSFFTKKQQTKNWLRRLAIVLALFYSNPFLANKIMSSWEAEVKLYSSIEKKYDYGVVLCGITDAGRSPKDRAHFLKGADRIIHTLDLYRLGKVRKIIISGGSGKVIDQTAIESDELRYFLVNAKVRKKDILVERASRNTYENAKYSTELINAANSDSDVLLITSAFHIKRASKCFAKQGLKHDTFPTDYYGADGGYTPEDLFLPSVKALSLWSVMIKEWIGLAAYWVMGYI